MPGRGGQHIKVYPSYNAIVVTTANGFDYDEINPLLMAAFVDPNKPLPANPANVAELDRVRERIGAACTAPPVRTLPDMAQAISVRPLCLDQMLLDIATLSLDSNDTAEATLYMKLEGRDVVWPIGLDGKYRFA